MTRHRFIFAAALIGFLLGNGTHTAVKRITAPLVCAVRLEIDPSIRCGMERDNRCTRAHPCRWMKEKEG